MKRNVQIGVASIAGSLLLFAGVALAAENAMTGDAVHGGSGSPSSMMMMHPPAPMILSVTNDGMGRLRGVVASVSATSITVAGWGGVWTINADANTTILPAGSALSDIKVGDFVGAMGKVSEDAPTITATIVRDWTAKKNAMMHSDNTMGTSSGAMMH